MRKDKYAKIINITVSYSLAASLMIGLVACGNSDASSSDNASPAVEVSETSEPDTVSTVIEVADVIEDEDGNILDAVSHEKLTDEEIEKKISEGVLKKDKTGKITIDQNKNIRKSAITIDTKTNEIISAEAGDGKTYTINDGKITAPKNEGVVKVDVNTSDKKDSKAKASDTTENKTEKKAAESTKTTEAKTEEKTTADTVKKTEEITERASEGRTEKTTQQKAENITEKATEARTERKTEAPTQQRTEAPTQTKTEAPTQARTEAPTQQRTEAPTQTKTEAPTQARTEAPTQAKTEAPTCSHNWVWHTHTETVHKSEQYLVSEPWDEPVYASHDFCNGCGTDLTATYGGALTDAAGDHLAGCGTGYHNESVQVDTIHHDAVYDTDEWDEYEEKKDYQYCSKCGVRK